MCMGCLSRVWEHDRTCSGRVWEHDRTCSGRVWEHDRTCSGRVWEHDSTFSGTLWEYDRMCIGSMGSRRAVYGKQNFKVLEDYINYQCCQSFTSASAPYIISRSPVVQQATRVLTTDISQHQHNIKESNIMATQYVLNIVLMCHKDSTMEKDHCISVSSFTPRNARTRNDNTKTYAQSQHTPV
jgi:hypothetical protein